MYLLVTYFMKDQTLDRYVYKHEDLPGNHLVMSLASSKVISIEIDKYSKDELIEMGIKGTGKVG